MHVFSRWNTIFNVQCPSPSLCWLNPHLWDLVKKITTFAGSISMFVSSWVKASFRMIQFMSIPSFLSFCFTATKATCAPALSRHGHGRVSRIYTWQKNTWLCWYLGLHTSYDVPTLSCWVRLDWQLHQSCWNFLMSNIGKRGPFWINQRIETTEHWLKVAWLETGKPFPFVSFPYHTWNLPSSF